MMAKILHDLLKGRDVQSMRCSEARQIVNEFYLRVYCETLGTRNPQAVDYIAGKVLENAGLGFFA